MTRISIGIAAYNSERNIVQILQSLVSQKTDNFLLQEIIVHSDCSTDNTVALVRSIKNDKIRIIDNNERKGFAGSAVTLIENFKGDILVLLNDDIKIIDNNFLSKLLKPFSEGGVGLVGGNVQPLPPQTFVERAGVSAFRAYEKMRLAMSTIHNRFTYDGAVMAVSESFAKDISFPVDMAQMGNFDSFLYSYSILKEVKYRYAVDAIVYVRLPSTLKDYLKRSIRNTSQYKILKNEFGTRVKENFKKPFWLYLKCVFTELIKNPFGIAYVFIMSFYVHLIVWFSGKALTSTWEVVESSKYLEI